MIKISLKYSKRKKVSYDYVRVLDQLEALLRSQADQMLRDLLGTLGPNIIKGLKGQDDKTLISSEEADRYLRSFKVEVQRGERSISVLLVGGDPVGNLIEYGSSKLEIEPLPHIRRLKQQAEIIWSDLKGQMESAVMKGYISE